MTTQVPSDNSEVPVFNLGDIHTLDLSDIENAVKIIDHAADQGAFRGWDTINGVMNVRNRLVLFLKQQKPDQLNEQLKEKE